MLSSEYLSKDILDANFINVFSPFHRFQWLLGSCRVHVRDRFVTAPTVYQKLYTTFIAISTGFFSCYIIYCIWAVISDNFIYHFLDLIVIFIQTFSFLSNIIHVRFVNSDTNTRFYIQMQDVDRFMKIENKRPIHDMLRKTNYTVVSIILFTLLILLVASISTGPISMFEFFGGASTLTALFVEISHCSNILLYFVIRIRFINAIVINHIKHEISEEKINNVRSNNNKSIMRKLARQSHDFRTSEIHIYLEKLFACFKTYQNLHSFQVSN